MFVVYLIIYSLFHYLFIDFFAFFLCGKLNKQEDLLIHGDSVYDIIEKQDHQTIQNELMRSPSSSSTSALSSSSSSTNQSSTNQSSPISDSRIFLCRMNVSRNSRRQMRFGDQKVSFLRKFRGTFVFNQYFFRKISQQIGCTSPRTFC